MKTNLIEAYFLMTVKPDMTYWISLNDIINGILTMGGRDG